MKPITSEERRVDYSGTLFCVSEQVVPDEGTMILQNFRNYLQKKLETLTAQL
jgi:hypothetical protein